MNPMEDFEMAPFFERTLDLVCIASKEGYFKKINPAVIHTLEYSEEELMAQPIASFMHPEDRLLTAGEREKLLNGIPLVNFQNRYVTKTGKTVWLHWTSIYFPEKEVVFALAKVITERKLLELELEEKYRMFKGLATHFKTTIEKDRKHMAMELHEQVAQLAAAVKMDLDWLAANLGALSNTTAIRMEHAIAMADLMIATIRKMSFSFSPHMIDDIGFTEALQWLCREFTVLYQIPCRFECAGEPARLTHEVKLDFFRICQEVLSIIIDHERAGRITIHLKESKHTVCLTIRDEGCGLNRDLENLVWTSIRERVISINGEISLPGEARAGRAVCVSLEL